MSPYQLAKPLGRFGIWRLLSRRIIALFFLAASSFVAANDSGFAVITGNDFLAVQGTINKIEGNISVSDQELLRLAHAMGTIQTIRRLNQVLAGLHKKEGYPLRYVACIPREVTKNQAMSVVMQFIEAFPAQRHMSIETLAQTAVLRAYPCQQDGVR